MSGLSEGLLRLIPLAVVGSSLLGSLHCVTMCGGLIAASARNGREVLAYQLGRLGSYLALGGLAGLAGRALLESGIAPWLGWVAALAIGSTLIVMGVRVWSGRGAHLFRVPQEALAGFYRRARSPWAIGALSALLPCGWLHSYVLGAAATGGAGSGMIFLFLFWLGTLPALSAAPVLAQRLLQPLARSAPRMCASLLIVAGLASIGAKVASVVGSGDASHAASAHCHSDR